MSARNDSRPAAPADAFESPYLLDELFAGKAEPEWETSGALLTDESPFRTPHAHESLVPCAATERSEVDADLLSLMAEAQEPAPAMPPVATAGDETAVEAEEAFVAEPPFEAEEAFEPAAGYTGELFEGPFVPEADEHTLYLEELVDEEVFDRETSSAQQEWQAARSIHRHFHGDTPAEKFASYLALRPLYREATGASNPARWLTDNIVTLSFFGRTTPGHRDLRAPLAAAEETLRRQDRTPQLTHFWAFVPRRMRTRNRLSNHALGRAVDINHPTNPHIFNPGEILVIREATGVDLGKQQPHDAMRQASRRFQQAFNAQWLQAQSTEVRRAAAARRARLQRYARNGFLNLEQSMIDALIGAGFTWGGDWQREKDFMHFELPTARRGATPAAGASGTQSPAPGSGTADPTITRDHVRFAQRVLNAVGGENLRVDGIHGPLTAGALERFRGSTRVGAGGALDRPTLLALAQRALEQIRRQSLFGRFGVLDAATREALAAFRAERGLGGDARLDPATMAALADALGE